MGQTEYWLNVTRNSRGREGPDDPLCASCGSDVGVGALDLCECGAYLCDDCLCRHSDDRLESEECEP